MACLSWEQAVTWNGLSRASEYFWPGHSHPQRPLGAVDSLFCDRVENADNVSARYQGLGREQGSQDDIMSRLRVSNSSHSPRLLHVGFVKGSALHGEGPGGTLSCGVLVDLLALSEKVLRTSNGILDYDWTGTDIIRKRSQSTGTTTRASKYSRFGWCE